MAISEEKKSQQPPKPLLPPEPPLRRKEGHDQGRTTGYTNMAIITYAYSQMRWKERHTISRDPRGASNTTRFFLMNLRHRNHGRLNRAVDEGHKRPVDGNDGLDSPGNIGNDVEESAGGERGPAAASGRPTATNSAVATRTSPKRGQQRRGRHPPQRRIMQLQLGGTTLAILQQLLRQQRRQRQRQRAPNPRLLSTVTIGTTATVAKKQLTAARVTPQSMLKRLL